VRKDFVSLRLTRKDSLENEQRNRPLLSCYLVTHLWWIFFIRNFMFFFL